MAAPPITVVTATYNYPGALQVAIQSALDQTEDDFEYLIVGDGCDDETEDVVRSASDERIRWHNLPENLGNQADVNRVALEMARGGLIAYLNHDDIWYPEHLEVLRACIDDGGFEVASSLALGISPPPHAHREVLGLGGVFGEDRTFRVHAMTSSVMHTAEAARKAGGWKRWRESERIPTIEFFGRLRDSCRNHAVVPRITSLKFHSADRRNSYQLKDAHEQLEWHAKMKQDPDLRHRELAAALALRALRVPVPKLEQQPRPSDAPPGWEIEQYRRLRGLPANADFGAELTAAAPEPSPDLRAYGVVATGHDRSFWTTDPALLTTPDDAEF